MVKVQRLFAKTNLKIRVCEAQRSNESPSGAFKRPNGLAQQDGGALPRQVRVCGAKQNNESPTGAFIATQTRTFLKPIFTGGVVTVNCICRSSLCPRNNKHRRVRKRSGVPKLSLFTAKGPAAGNTPRCDGTSAPQPGPWRLDAAPPDPPRGIPPARWGTP